MDKNGDTWWGVCVSVYWLLLGSVPLESFEWSLFSIEKREYRSQLKFRLKSDQLCQSINKKQWRHRSQIFRRKTAKRRRLPVAARKTMEHHHPRKSLLELGVWTKQYTNCNPCSIKKKKTAIHVYYKQSDNGRNSDYKKFI